MKHNQNFLKHIFTLTMVTMISFTVSGCNTHASTNSAQAIEHVNTTSQREETTSATEDSNYDGSLSLENDNLNSATIIAMTKKDGTVQYSLDGGTTYMSEDDFKKAYPETKIVWWTYDEYTEYINEQKEILQDMVDNKIEGYTNSKGHFVWTQEMLDETMKKYYDTLENIKNGTKVSKSIGNENMLDNSGDAIGYESYKEEPTEKICEVNIQLSNGEEKHFYAANKTDLLNQVKEFCNRMVDSGKMTSEECDSIMNDIK